MRLLVLLLFVAAGFAQSTTPASAHVRRTGQITLQGPVDKVFPLLALLMKPNGLLAGSLR